MIEAKGAPVLAIRRKRTGGHGRHCSRKDIEKSQKTPDT